VEEDNDNWKIILLNRNNCLKSQYKKYKYKIINQSDMGNCQCGDTKLCGDNGSNLNINDILTKGSIFDDVKSK
jgi:hypothetical protein